MLEYAFKQVRKSDGSVSVESKMVDEVGSHLTQRSLPAPHWTEVSVNVPKDDKDRIRFIHCIYGPGMRNPWGKRG